MKSYRANILFAPSFGALTSLFRGFVVVDGEGRVKGVYEALPEQYQNLPCVDFGDKLLIPAFADIHLHASQAPIQGLGHEDGADWFTDFCYPAEERYADRDYAAVLNSDLVRALWEHGTMHANIMCTVNVDSAKNLFMQYAKTGMAALIGKMNSDCVVFGKALESTEASMRETREYVEWALSQSGLARPSLAPEFAPACTGQLMEFLGNLALERNLAVHSHMCEGSFDNEIVLSRFPAEKLYGRVYERFGLFGQTPTAMAHCITCTDEEIDLMARYSVFLAHCPNVVLNNPAPSRLTPVRKFIEAGVPVGIGSDIGGCHTLSIPQNIVATIQLSRLVPEYAPLTVAEAFYLATKGGGALFGKVGSFEEGYSFDALVVDDARWNRHVDYTLYERLTRFLYCGDSRDIARRFCAGREIVL